MTFASKTRNEKGWSSKIEVLQRYTVICDELKLFKYQEIEDLSLNVGENRRIDAFVTQLKKMEKSPKRFSNIRIPSTRDSGTRARSV